jgi:hypothetical protein
MSVELLAKEMNAYASTLIESTAHNPYPPGQLRSVEAHEPAMSRALAENWTSDIYPAIPASIRLAGTLACIQSLVNVASQRPHAHYIAAKVFDNFRTLSRRILTTPCLDTNQLFSYLGRKDKTPGRIAGQLSETALLGAIWWSIANDCRPEDTFALPTSRDEDVGYRDRDGFLTGVDIKMQSTTNSNTQLIQVKTSTNRHGRSHHVDNPYSPGIAIVPIRQLRDRRGRSLSPRHLLWLVANESDADLLAVNLQIDERLERAHERRSKQHRVRATKSKGQLTWREQLQQIGEELTQ